MLIIAGHARRHAEQIREIDRRGQESVVCRLAHFARSGAAAVGDHVGGHSRAQLSEALVDVLDDPLALFAAGQIDIDVRPFAALFGKKALEQQVHADRVTAVISSA